MNRLGAYVLLLAAIACTTKEEVGTSDARLVTEGTVVGVDNPTFSSSGTAQDFNLGATYSLIGSSPTSSSPIWFVAYEDHTSAAPKTTLGWATASTALSGGFTTCFDNAGSCNSIDKTGITFDHWATNPQPTAAGNGTGLVFAAAVYASTSLLDHDQVMLMMDDTGGDHLGQSSGQAISVTDGAADGCDTGEMRAPYVTVDSTAFPGTPLIYVVWGRKGSGSWGACIRSFSVALNTLITDGPVSAGHGVGSLDREGFNDGQGGLIAQAADGMVSVAYTNQDNVPSTTSGCSSNTGLAWEMTSSSDGSHWATSSTIVHTSSFDWCALRTTPGTDSTAKVIKRLREYDFVLSSGGISYVAVNDTAQTIRLYMSATRGIKIPNMNATNDSPWREFCPTVTHGSGVVVNWTDPGDPCPNALVAPSTDVFRPMLTVDGNGQLSLAWWQRDDGMLHGPAFAKLMYIGNVLPRLGTATDPWQPSSSTPQVLQGAFDPAVGGLDKHDALGWYQTMPSTRSSYNECSGATDIEAYWTNPSFNGLQNIFTAPITLTP